MSPQERSALPPSRRPFDDDAGGDGRHVTASDSSPPCSTASPPLHPPSSRFYSSSRPSPRVPRGSSLAADERVDQRLPTADQAAGLRRLRHPRPDLLRLRATQERQLSLPVSATRGPDFDRLTQDEVEGSNESDDDTLSSGLSGYYPPPPEPAPPDFIPSNYRSHQQDLMRRQLDEEIDADGVAAAAGICYSVAPSVAAIDFSFPASFARPLSLLPSFHSLSLSLPPSPSLRFPFSFRRSPSVGIDVFVVDL